MIKLHDIKDIIIIPDYSFYILIFISIFILLLAVFSSILFYKYYKNKHKINNKQEYYKILKNLDLNNTKRSAYLISKYSFLLCESVKEKNSMNEINDLLEEYKYKKNVNKFPKEFIVKYELFLESIDV